MSSDNLSPTSASTSAAIKLVHINHIYPRPALQARDVNENKVCGLKKTNIKTSSEYIQANEWLGYNKARLAISWWQPRDYQAEY